MPWPTELIVGWFLRWGGTAVIADAHSVLAVGRRQRAQVESCRASTLHYVEQVFLCLGVVGCEMPITGNVSCKHWLWNAHNELLFGEVMKTELTPHTSMFECHLYLSLACPN